MTEAPLLRTERLTRSFVSLRIAVQCRHTVLNCWTRADRLPGVADTAREILASVGLDTRAGGP